LLPIVDIKRVLGSVDKTTDTNALKQAEQTLLQVCWQNHVCSLLRRGLLWCP